MQHSNVHAFGNADSTMKTSTRLAALMKAMSEHPTVTYEEGNRSVTVDSGRAIFLLVSDVGAEGINAAVLRYSRRSDVAPVRVVFYFCVCVSCCCCCRLLCPAIGILTACYCRFTWNVEWGEEIPEIMKQQEI